MFISPEFPFLSIVYIYEVHIRIIQKLCSKYTIIQYLATWLLTTVLLEKLKRFTQQEGFINVLYI